MSPGSPFASFQVNISSFIANLPLMKDTTRFSTENGSGSTSQAASIIEALESANGIIDRMKATIENFEYSVEEKDRIEMLKVS